MTVETIKSTNQKPSFFQQAFSWFPGVKKEDKGIPVYVCGPACAEHAKADPSATLLKVIAGRTSTRP
jgi:hypothetical protein